jgi:hypothetical protein
MVRFLGRGMNGPISVSLSELVVAADSGSKVMELTHYVDAETGTRSGSRTLFHSTATGSDG